VTHEWLYFTLFSVSGCSLELIPKFKEDDQEAGGASTRSLLPHKIRSKSAHPTSAMNSGRHKNNGDDLPHLDNDLYSRALNQKDREGLLKLEEERRKIYWDGKKVFVSTNNRF
jgi:hypothetical protein